MVAGSIYAPEKKSLLPAFNSFPRVSELQGLEVNPECTDLILPISEGDIDSDLTITSQSTEILTNCLLSEGFLSREDVFPDLSFLVPAEVNCVVVLGGTHAFFFFPFLATVAHVFSAIFGIFSRLGASYIYTAFAATVIGVQGIAIATFSKLFLPFLKT